MVQCCLAVVLRRLAAGVAAITYFGSRAQG